MSNYQGMRPNTISHTVCALLRKVLASCGNVAHLRRLLLRDCVWSIDTCEHGERIHKSDLSHQCCDRLAERLHRILNAQRRCDPQCALNEYTDNFSCKFAPHPNSHTGLLTEKTLPLHINFLTPQNKHAPEHCEQPSQLPDHVHFVDHGLECVLHQFSHAVTTNTKHSGVGDCSETTQRVLVTWLGGRADKCRICTWPNTHIHTHTHVKEQK